MNGLLIGFAVVLILAILLMVFRIQNLVDLVSGGEKKGGASNQINAALMLLIPGGLLALGIWYTPIAAESFLPEASSLEGKMTDQLFWITIVIITAMFLITNFALFIFAFLYQYREGKKVSFFHDNTIMETVWTIIPAVIMAVLVFYGNDVWWELKRDAPEDAVQLEIMGHQFAWKVRYPGEDGKLGKYDYRLIDVGQTWVPEGETEKVPGSNEVGIDFEDPNAEDDFMAGEIHIPVNKTVKFNIRARDVLHSVFAPHFRMKMDAVPGMPTSFHFTPDKTTAEMRTELGDPEFNYEIACTEVCGKGHFAMKFIVVVEDEKSYNNWYAEQQTFLELNPVYKDRGLSDVLKRNIANKENKTDKQASL